MKNCMCQWMPWTPTPHSAPLDATDIRSDVEIQIKLPRMRTQPDRIDLMLALVLEPRVDDVFGEDVASAQKLVVGLQRLQGFIERTRHLANAPRFLGRQVVNIDIERVA